jgi:hypothetical protein
MSSEMRMTPNFYVSYLESNEFCGGKRPNPKGSGVARKRALSGCPHNRVSNGGMS